MPPSPVFGGGQPMNNLEAKTIIDLLADGIDPTTGEQLPEDHFLNRRDCIRALSLASNALGAGPKRTRSYPENYGAPWLETDDQVLRQMHSEGIDVGKMAAHLRRTRSGIKGRLNRLGLLTNEQ